MSRDYPSFYEKSDWYYDSGALVNKKNSYGPGETIQLRAERGPHVINFAESLFIYRPVMKFNKAVEATVANIVAANTPNRHITGMYWFNDCLSWC